MCGWQIVVVLGHGRDLLKDLGQEVRCSDLPTLGRIRILFQVEELTSPGIGDVFVRVFVAFVESTPAGLRPKHFGFSSALMARRLENRSENVATALATNRESPANGRKSVLTTQHDLQPVAKRHEFTFRIVVPVAEGSNAAACARSCLSCGA
jgi:hypothetical protein